MGFYTGTAKSTYLARPDIPATKKLTAAEFNALTALINTNYQDYLDLVDTVNALDANLPIVPFNTDYNITSKGIYIFYGATPRTVTIDDAILGRVNIRTIATEDLTLSGSITSEHLGIISVGNANTDFIWDTISEEYTY